ncbi:MAG: hypothetical protein ACLQME_11300 [Alphaproteobacteria bacterium]
MRGSALVLFLVSSLCGVPLARWALPRADARQLLLMSPAVTITVWSLALGAGVMMDIPIRSLWAPFWAGTLLSSAAGGWLIGRRASAKDLCVILAPAAAAMALLAPYVYYGFADYQGSWFWDGWAYLAEGEALWKYPHDAPVLGLGVMYDYGHRLASFARFISGALVAVFRDVLPLGGDSQEALGHFLLLCTFAFGCSCYFLARAVMPGYSVAQLCFVVASTFSGFTLNLVYANNFDHLLGIAIGPFIAGMAVIVRWRGREAILVGAAMAALLCIYPEMGVILALPTAIVMAWRLWRCRPRYRRLAAFAGLLLLVVFLATLPWQKVLLQYMAMQLEAGTASGTRPGEGYFHTLFDAECSPGAMFGLYAPFQPCTRPLILNLLKDAVAVIGALLVLAGAWRPGRAMVAPFALSALIIALGTALMLLEQEYDYGAFKILASGWYVLALLMVVGAGSLAAQGPYFQKAISALALAYVAVIGLRVWQLAGDVAVKDMAYFRTVEHLADFDPRARIAVQLSDSLALEWALYYLRDRPLAVAGLNHPYLFALDEFYERQLQSGLGEAAYLLSDTRYDDCFGHAVRQGGPYLLYKLPSGVRTILTYIRGPNGSTEQSGRVALAAGDQDTRISIFSVSEGIAKLSADLALDPGGSGFESLRLLIRSNLEDKEVAVDQDGHIAVDVKVPAGRSEIRLRVLDQGAAGSPPPRIDARQIAVCAPA